MGTPRGITNGSQFASKSRTRRSKVVPNWSCDRRPSSSKGKDWRPSHFFKIILPSTLADKKLMIPERFAGNIGDELSTIATLTLPSGRVWQVGLKKDEKKIWFHEGWQDFVKSNSVGYGYFLVFRYEGNSNFYVLVFDTTATEIQYGLGKSSELEDPGDSMELDDTKKSRQGILNKTEMSTKNEDRETSVREKLSSTSSKTRRMMCRGRERAIKAARMLKPKAPSFISVLRPYLYVPAGFACKYLRQHQIAILKIADGQQWSTKYRPQTPSSSAVRIGEGWTEFSRENNLEKGDVCVFELIQMKPVVLNVSIFRVADYA
ncbi:B3 domain-containing transcription factor VRN1 [Morella rubra]|uniref:B3 domain-containing transcription factor VRN1 n=1 Tax=Morella rubra TaxID=262757 RepID=A0A6A1V3V1_9ROSI|nr:B3 domain-containing transcription factor VRN1 [Morella rubra]